MKQIIHPASRAALYIAGAAAVLSFMFFAWAVRPVHAATFGPLSQQMGVGSRGAQVTQLQTFLALSHDIYPDAAITGYYGRLTQGAVEQFQVYYGLPSVGRVGPQTLTKLNAVMAMDKGLDINAPIISGVTVNQASGSATITWITNENSTSSVFYSTAPIVIGEATANFTSPTISGATAGTDSTMSTVHSVSLNGLSSNTNYYYVVRSIDGSGNVSMSWPVFFHTN